MEGPSIVIACEEFKPFLKRKIQAASGAANLPFSSLKGNSLTRAQSWGKHLLLSFKGIDLRIEFTFTAAQLKSWRRAGRKITTGRSILCLPNGTQILRAPNSMRNQSTRFATF